MSSYFALLRRNLYVCLIYCKNQISSLTIDIDNIDDISIYY